MSALSILARLHQQSPPVDTSTSSPALLIGLGVIAAGALYLYSNPSTPTPPTPTPATNPNNVISSANVKFLGPTGTTPGALQVEGARFFCSAADAEQKVSVPLSSHPRTNVMGVSSKVGGGSTCLDIQDSPALITASTISGTCPDFMTQASNKLSPGGRITCNLNYSSTSAKYRDLSNPVLAILVPGGPGLARNPDVANYEMEYVFNSDDYGNDLQTYGRPQRFKDIPSSLLNVTMGNAPGPGTFTPDSGSVFNDTYQDLSTNADSSNSQLLLVSAKNRYGTAPSVQDMCQPEVALWLSGAGNPTGHRQVALSWRDAFGSDSGLANGQILANDGFGNSPSSLMNFAKISLVGGDSVTASEFTAPSCPTTAAVAFNPQVASINITPQYYGAVDETATGLYETSAGPSRVASVGGSLVWGQVVCPANARCTKTETAADGSLICSNVNASKAGPYQISCNALDLPGGGESSWIEAPGDSSPDMYVYDSYALSCIKNCASENNLADEGYCTSTCASSAISSWTSDDSAATAFTSWVTDYGFSLDHFGVQATQFTNYYTKNPISFSAFTLQTPDAYSAAANTFTFTPSLYL